MDFQSFTDSLFSPSCVVSVEKTKDGEYGDIRIVAGNKKYTDMIDMRAGNDVPKDMMPKQSAFIPNSLYTDYYPQNRYFEDICYRAAVKKQEVHTYAHLSNIDIWFNIFALPMEGDGEDNIFYCSYTAIPSENSDDIFDDNGSGHTSEDVLKTCIKLHKADNLKDAMGSVISDIRRICGAEGCTVLLINYEDEEYSILATDFAKDSTIRRVTSFPGYYTIAASWKDMIGEEGDCIIVQNKDDFEKIKEVNNPWYLTLVEAGVKSVVLFPLRQGNEILGFIWATNFDTSKTARIKETLELTTFFISSHTARYKVVERLKHMGYTDALTDLPNRFAYSERIANLIGFDKEFAVVSIDINNFKGINDSLGFDAGNRVLIEIAKRWKEVSKKITETDGDDITTYLSRIAADEFSLVITGFDSDKTLKKIITKYENALGEMMTVDGVDFYVSASFGYAMYPADADCADALTSHANTAMNEVKKVNSSNHILRFSPDLLKNEHVLEVENLIRSALENDTIFFNLQPQYDMAHRLRGFEALARMKDPDGNIVSPGEFIPVAEKVGLIDRVDGTVFRKAALFFGELLERTGADLTLSINASVRHLMKNDFMDEIRTLLVDSGIPANKLEIEITESIMIDSFDKALKCIEELKSMGIQIAIDDFGTGYSSLSYLNRFPATLLKIDKSFIDKMNTGDKSKQYVAAIISIGHIMGFEVISEGVEDERQLDTLRAIGCDYVQGFIWGRPLPEEEVTKLVESIRR